MRWFSVIFAASTCVSVSAAAEEVTFSQVQKCSVELAAQVVRQPQYATSKLWKDGWETFDDAPESRQKAMLDSMTDAMRSNLSDIAAHLNYGEDLPVISYKTYGIDDFDFFLECAGLKSAAPGSDFAGYAQAVEASTRSCWNSETLSLEARMTTLSVTLSFMNDGRPIASSIRMIESWNGSDAAAHQAFQSVRRAIIRCGAKGFDLPRENFPEWQSMTLTFAPIPLLPNAQN